LQFDVKPFRARHLSILGAAEVFEEGNSTD
jgi:hypothetical protein